MASDGGWPLVVNWRPRRQLCCCWRRRMPGAAAEVDGRAPPTPTRDGRAAAAATAVERQTERKTWPISMILGMLSLLLLLREGKEERNGGRGAWSAIAIRGRGRVLAETTHSMCHGRVRLPPDSERLRLPASAAIGVWSRDQCFLIFSESRFGISRPKKKTHGPQNSLWPRLGIQK